MPSYRVENGDNSHSRVAGTGAVRFDACFSPFWNITATLTVVSKPLLYISCTLILMGVFHWDISRCINAALGL